MTVRPIRDAAVTVLFRRRDRGVEVFWLRREKTLRFAGGFYAFPGGKLDPQDVSTPVASANGADAALVVAAARELFEEAGVLIARGAERLPRETLSGLRQRLMENGDFGALLTEHGLSLSAQDFRAAGRWLTPDFMPVRFDARFFLAELPSSQQAIGHFGESAEAEWIRPEAALALWEAGSALLHPPALHALRVLRDFRNIDEAALRLSSPPHCEGFVSTRIEFQQGIHLCPLRTPTLPPATHTNSYVLGNGELLVVDAGTDDAPELDRLVRLIRSLEAEGRRAVALLLTHHHIDHVGGVQEMKDALGVPVWCHARTAEHLDVTPDRMLCDGERIILRGEPEMSWLVLHTPGHARGHLCLLDERSKAAAIGDMVSGVSTILIDPPEGNMRDYLGQLERLRSLPVGALYPSHGPVMPDGPAKLGQYLEHRRRREQLVVEALRSGASRLGDVVSSAYAELGPGALPIAERSTVAILEKLVEEGTVVERDGEYQLGSSD